MLILNHTVPEALILPEPPRDLATLLRAHGAHWFSADPAFVTRDPGPPETVTDLCSRTSAACAVQTAANRNHTVFAAQGGAAHLVFAKGQHCGFMWDGTGVDPQNWSCAIRFHAADNDARTLMTLNPEGTDNYVFLQQISGQMILKDQQNTLELARSATGSEGPMLVTLGMSQNRLWLHLSGETTQSSAARIDLIGPLTFLIGCRSNKPRLLKTLGGFHLFDVVIWPDSNILDQGADAPLEALEQGDLWRPTP